MTWSITTRLDQEFSADQILDALRVKWCPHCGSCRIEIQEQQRLDTADVMVTHRCLDCGVAYSKETFRYEL